MRTQILLLASCLTVFSLPVASSNGDDTPQFRLAKFDIDATPSVGFMMAYDRVKRVDELGLRCRGVVLIGQEDPIVLCAVDWIGIGNESQDAFKSTIAKAAGTTPDRVAVHTLHQHDAPRSDFSAEALLHGVGATDLGPHSGSLARELLPRLRKAVASSIESAVPVSKIGHGTADVQNVASNRRILGDDGKVKIVRYTATRDPAVRAEPVGVIDPQLSCISFWNANEPIAALTYYACHPQSYYRTGIPSPDFPGIARFLRGQALPGVLHVHFNGAGGNIGAGKYNDGSPANRTVLADRVADAMRQAWDNTELTPVTAGDLGWQTVNVGLPVAPHLSEPDLVAALASWNPTQYWGSPDKLAWLRRCKAGHTISIGCLRLGNVRVLHMPGELFVEYQLAAKKLRPDLHVAMAAYGDYGPGYIGTKVAYEQGGYETSQRASNVAPESEAVLMDAVRKLLEVTE